MAKYIWHNPCDKSRNPYAAFRKTFWLDDAKNIASADFNIFADTIYKLWVNGTFVGFGPVRFDPRFPQFDTYDLSPYLKNGKNAIAVLANFHGHKTYKNVPEVAAMIAWGKICDIDLSTNAKNWKCEAHAAYLRYTPKLSFALNAQIFYDQAKFDEDWTNPDYDDQAWNDAVELVDQTHFGELAPREIPFMSMEKLPLNTNTKIFPLVINEELYSYSLEPPYKADDGMKPDETYDKTIKWQTYIYSPVAQNIIAGTLWETILVNDLPCGSKVTDEAKPLRENFVMSLNEGWNQVSGSGNIFQDIYDCYLALPKNRGLSVFADKNKNSGHIFKYKKIAPKGEEETWAYTTKKDKAESPCREASWDTYGSCAQSLAPDQLNGFTFEKTLYPDGFSLLFDMEHMTLAFPSFVFSGTKGATIDLTYNDRLTSDGKHIRQESWIPLGDRIVCSNDAIDWSPISPRGFRYLALTFRNTKGDITLKNLDFISAHYPTKKIGSFECSDPALNKIWEMCALTQSINMEDAYDDCVDRERGLYVLDTLVQYHNNLACFGDHKLMKRCLEIYAQSLHPNGQFRCIYPNTGDYVLPDFSLYAIDAFYSYYMYTGDKNLISTWWEAIKTNLGVFDALSDERTDCLLDADPPDPNKPHDKRTRHLGDGGCTNNRGINCIFTCLYLVALRGARFLAKELNKEKEACDMEKRIATLEISIPAAFWSEERGLFSDNDEFKYFSPHASLYAIRAGVASLDKLATIQKNIRPLLNPFFKNGYDGFGGVAFTASFGYYMLDTLYRAGMGDIAETCIKEGWGWFLSMGLLTTPEHFDLKASQCHAWAASPAYVLSRHLLGVNFDTRKNLNIITLDVKPNNVKWAKGKFPHPLGEIEIGWHKDETGLAIFDIIEAPDGVRLKIAKTNDINFL